MNSKYDERKFLKDVLKCYGNFFDQVIIDIAYMCTHIQKCCILVR